MAYWTPSGSKRSDFIRGVGLNLLPAPVSFLYEPVLNPLKPFHFGTENDSDFEESSIYEEIMSLNKKQLEWALFMSQEELRRHGNHLENQLYSNDCLRELVKTKGEQFEAHDMEYLKRQLYMEGRSTEFITESFVETRKKIKLIISRIKQLESGKGTDLSGAEGSVKIFIK